VDPEGLAAPPTSAKLSVPALRSLYWLGVATAGLLLWFVAADYALGPLYAVFTVE